MTLEDHLPPGTPHEAVEEYYRQAGKKRTEPRTDEQQAQHALYLVKQGETWHLPSHLNGPAHDAARTGSTEPLVKAIARSRTRRP